MKSREHAVGSLAVGVAGAWLLSLPMADWLAVAWAVGLGVGIDFDHFLVARLRTGDWRAVRRCLADPTIVFVDQEAIFDVDWIRPNERLLSHVILGGALVGGLWLVDPVLAGFTAAVLYVHLLSDLVWDVFLQGPDPVAESENADERRDTA